MSARVCLVTSGHLSTNPRLVKEADALIAAGYKVTIVATKFIGWADVADTEFVKRPWLVKTIAFGAMANPLQRAYQSIRRRLARKAIGLFGFKLSLVEWANHWVMPELMSAANKIPAQLFIAHNLAALPAAVKAARRYGARVIFDAEDFHSGELPEGSQWDFDRELTITLEKKYLPLCDAMTAASPGIARAYADKYRMAEPDVVLNVFPKDRAPSQANAKGMAVPGPSLYWFSQTIGTDRGLETAVQAIGLSQSRPHLYLRGNVSDAYRKTLMQLATENGVSEKIHFLKPESPGKMVRLAAEFDVGLAAEPGFSMNNRLACSNKIFTYLLAGIPALATSTPAQAELAESMQGAVWLYPPGDAAALSSILDQLLLDQEMLARARMISWQLGQQRFNSETEYTEWLIKVDGLISRQQIA